MGIHYLKRGFHELRRPEFRAYIWLPLILNIALYALIVYQAIGQFTYWNDYFINSLPSWLSFLSWALWPLFIILLLLIVAYTFTILANIIASPFNALLSEKVEQVILNKSIPTANSLRDWLWLIPHSIGRELRKWVYFLPRIALLIVVSFVPVINAIAPLLWFVFGAWGMAIQYCDFCADNHQQSFNMLRRGLERKRWAYMGFGGAVAGLSMIPIISIIVIPVAVIGSTLMWSENSLEGS